MKVISFENIKKLEISPAVCYEWVAEMIANKADALLPPKTHMNMPGNIFCNVMPGIIHFDGKSWGGVKVVTRYPERKPALDSKILLFDADSGTFLALLDGNWITAMRTGAVAAHSIQLLAKKEYKTVGIIGLGNTARATMRVLDSFTRERELKIKLLRYKDQAELFQDRFKDLSNIQFCVVDSPDEVVKGSDVVVSCATYFENDICEDHCFDEGILVVPVHTRGFTNCDLFFDKIYADDRGHVDHFKNFSKFRRFAEVSDVVNGRAEGRVNDQERILAYNIGLSIHDIFFAAQIYSSFEKEPVLMAKLPDANLKDPIEKFWV